MNKSYLAHDCVIGEGVVMSAGVLLGGRVEIGEYSNLGLGVTVHQRKHIVANAMIGMQSVVTKDILPFSLVAGNPARILRLNRIGAERVGFEEKHISEMESLFHQGRFDLYETDNPILKEINKFFENHPDSLKKLKGL